MFATLCAESNQRLYGNTAGTFGDLTHRENMHRVALNTYISNKHIFNQFLSRWSFECMQLRSGKQFTPCATNHIFYWQTRHADPVSTSVDLGSLIQTAFTLEDERFEQGLSDCEGLGVLLRPPSLLIQCETDTEPESSNHPTYPSGIPGSRSVPVEKKCRNAAANKCRSRKRVKTSTSGHQPHAYAARPSTVKQHVNEYDALHAPADAGSFSASGSGSWVGKRKEGAKKTPWTVPELMDEGFKVIEWDGR